MTNWIIISALQYINYLDTQLDIKQQLESNKPSMMKNIHEGEWWRWLDAVKSYKKSW